MTVLVTGGSGLVGSHVIEALRNRGERPRALVRPESQAIVEALGAEGVPGDVTDAAAWNRASTGIRGIIHAAALVAPRAPFAEFERVNVGGTRLALEAARRAAVPLIHVSSVAVYGRSARSAAGVTEDYHFEPLPDRDYYARTKRMAEHVVREEAERLNIRATAIRPNVIYGERDRLFTPRVIATVRRGFVPQVGRGTNHLSCIYAGNVASAILAALDAPPAPGFRAYNVTHDAPPELTQREFLMTFAEALGKHPPVLRIPVVVARTGASLWQSLLQVVRPGRYAGLGAAAVAFVTGENPFDSNRIRRELKWKPPFDCRTAVYRTAQSF